MINNVAKLTQVTALLIGVGLLTYGGYAYYKGKKATKEKSNEEVKPTPEGGAAGQAGESSHSTDQRPEATAGTGQPQEAVVGDEGTPSGVKPVEVVDKAIAGGDTSHDDPDDTTAFFNRLFDAAKPGTFRKAWYKDFVNCLSESYNSAHPVSCKAQIRRVVVFPIQKGVNLALVQNVENGVLTHSVYFRHVEIAGKYQSVPFHLDTFMHSSQETTPGQALRNVYRRGMELLEIADGRMNATTSYRPGFVKDEMHSPNSEFQQDLKLGRLDPVAKMMGELFELATADTDMVFDDSVGSYLNTIAHRNLEGMMLKALGPHQQQFVFLPMPDVPSKTMVLAYRAAGYVQIVMPELPSDYAQDPAKYESVKWFPLSVSVLKFDGENNLPLDYLRLALSMRGLELQTTDGQYVLKHS